MTKKYGGLGTDTGFVMHDADEEDGRENFEEGCGQDYDYDYDLFDDDFEAYCSKMRILKKGVSRTLEALFGGFMSRSMGEFNFLVVGAMGLMAAKMISAQFIDASFLGELNAIAFFIAIGVLAAFTFSEKCPANPIAALCIACLPTIIEIVSVCAVRGIDADVYLSIGNWGVVGAVTGAILGLLSYLVADADEDDMARRMFIGLAWGMAIGATAALFGEMAPYIAREIACRETPTYLEWMPIG